MRPYFSIGLFSTSLFFAFFFIIFPLLGLCEKIIYHIIIQIEPEDEIALFVDTSMINSISVTTRIVFKLRQLYSLKAMQICRICITFKRVLLTICFICIRKLRL
jgi:hypothetical protein